MELDPEIVSVAERFFDVIPNKGIKVNVCDGIEFVKNAHLASKKGEFFKTSSIGGRVRKYDFKISRGSECLTY